MMKVWGKSEYGYYAYYISIATILLAIAEFGTPNVFRRNYTDTESHTKKEVYSSLYVLRLLFITPIALTFLGLGWYYNSLFFIYYSLVTVIISFRLNEYKLEMNSENKFISKMKSLIYLFGLITKVTAIYNGATLETIGLITLIEHCLFTLAFIKRTGFDFKFNMLKKDLLKAFFYTSAAFASTYIIALLGGKIYTLLVFNVLGSEETAVFAFSTRMLEILLVPTQVFPVVIIPLLMKSTLSRDILYTHINRAFSYLYLGITICSVFVLPIILPYIIDGTENIVQFLPLYCLTLVFSLGNTLAGVYFISLNYNKILIYRSLGLLISNLSTGLLFMELWGLLGTIYSIIFSFFIVDIVGAVFSLACRKEYRFRLAGFLKPWLLLKSILNLSETFRHSNKS
ncbi:lipopolysaccharide biosynthesis protein [Pseudoalteromonas sp. SG45-1]|uniref:lipopolysaccharide biosynthesis protein n=1 Tax=Pseudoalteromonas sp. SG45-1 TaxID=2760957 RepID=UPI001602FCE6|nr:hypothetical protein [Pseudoalteromonas sp. SG45-1]MBB1402139.1 hypothetical protein [Pseudoalteromonas sp. SG45-1]